MPEDIMPHREPYLPDHNLNPPDEADDDLDPEAEAERAADEKYEHSRDPEWRRHRQRWLSSTANPFA